MKSNVEILVEATGIDSEIVQIIYNRNRPKLNGYIANYRHYKRSGKNVESLSKKIYETMFYGSNAFLISPRNINSEISVPMAVLNKDGFQNLKIVSYLLDSHYFLVSNALALIGGFVNGASATSIISSKFRSKVNFLNSISYKDSMSRLKAFLEENVRKNRTEKADIVSILEGITFQEI